MLTRPEVGGMKPVTMRMVVDLPAPLGPRKPSTSPRSTVNETSSTARFAPKVFTRFSILIIYLRVRGRAAGLGGGALSQRNSGVGPRSHTAGLLHGGRLLPRGFVHSSAKGDPMRTRLIVAA